MKRCEVCGRPIYPWEKGWGYARGYALMVGQLTQMHEKCEARYNTMYDNIVDSVKKWYKVYRADGRIEYNCEHHIGHGNHIHGCDGCCDRDDFPGKEEMENE